MFDEEVKRQKNLIPRVEKIEVQYEVLQAMGAITFTREIVWLFYLNFEKHPVYHNVNYSYILFDRVSQKMLH